MRPILFATFVVSMLMAFVGADLLGAVVQRNPSPAKFQQGKPNNKKDEDE